MLIKMFSDFEILLKSLSIEDASKIIDFSEATKVADIEDEEISLQQNIPSNRYRPTAKHTSDRSPIRLPSKNLRRLTNNVANARKSTNQVRSYTQIPHKLHTPIVLHQSKPTSKSVSFRKPDDPPKVSKPIEIQTIKNPELVKDDLLDLIPPDVDALDIDTESLFLITAELNELNHDDVSCPSSDDSFYSCKDFEQNVLQKPDANLTKPGCKLDVNALGPPAKEIISSFPETTIFKCDQPNCGFTTSNPMNIKLHCCSR